MSNPGNKRLQRAMSGASPSSAEGSSVTQADANGNYSVTRTKGSVINNGGNMVMGLYPRIGMSLGYLRKIHANPPDCCTPGKDD